jgi:hypothetical protein
MRKIISLAAASTTLAILLISAGASAQNPEQHVITEGDLTIIHDCHGIYLDEHDGSATLANAEHSTAYECYRTEHPVYETLVDMEAQGKISEQDRRLRRLVLDDVTYFELSLDSDEK